MSMDVGFSTLGALDRGSARHFSQSKVKHFHQTVFAPDHDVLGLDVAMNNTTR
jgi:hypothetical protein